MKKEVKMTKGLKMKIVIILDEPYPNGMACSNRTHLWQRKSKNYCYYKNWKNQHNRK